MNQKQRSTWDQTFAAADDNKDGKDALFNALKFLKLSAKNSEDIVCIVSDLGSNDETIEV